MAEMRLYTLTFIFLFWIEALIITFPFNAKNADNEATVKN